MQDKNLTQKYIDEKKELYDVFLSFIENPRFENKDFNEIINYINKQTKQANNDFFEYFLKLIVKLTNNHCRDESFMNKIFKTLQYFQKQIKQNFSNPSIFNIFKSNKLIILFLIKNGTLNLSNNVVKQIISLNPELCHFLKPEIQEFFAKKQTQNEKFELLTQNTRIDENFEEKRRIGENDSYLCALIRQDMVREFIFYVTKMNLPVDSAIESSIFETNSLLTQIPTTLIEYSAFFGSIKIFNFLRNNGANLSESLWIFAIHSRNAKLIHILEDLHVGPPNQSYDICVGLAIKYHHNELANYFMSNFKTENELELNEYSLECALSSHNYSYLTYDFDKNSGFFYLHKYEYNKLVDLYMKAKEKEIIKEIIKR